MPEINKDLLLSRIRRSGDFTAMEKRYLERLVNRAQCGQWIEDEYGFFRCSVCGYEWDEPEYSEPCCPKCGATMIGGTDNAKTDRP